MKRRRRRRRREGEASRSQYQDPQGGYPQNETGERGKLFPPLLAGDKKEEKTLKSRDGSLAVCVHFSFVSFLFFSCHVVVL